MRRRIMKKKETWLLLSLVVVIAITLATLATLAPAAG